MTKPATRLITLILLLQRKPNQTAPVLAAELGVSVRTLHRYMGMLDEMGIPIYSERGRYGGFSLVRGYKMPPLIFTPEEAVAVHLGATLVAEMWGRLYQEPAGGAIAKLDNVLPDEQRQEVAWAQRTLVSTGLHRADPMSLSPYLEALRKAARQERQVRITYQGSSKPGKTERVVDPYGLVHRSGWWYVVAYCHLRGALRTFRVDRIQNLEPLNLSFQKPQDFDIREYLQAELSDLPVTTARLQFLPQADFIVKSNQSSWESVEENPDGSLEVVLAAPDLNWLASMALSFGAWVKILEPPELKAIVRDWALETAALYEDI